jgi:hypothetical protein
VPLFSDAIEWVDCTTWFKFAIILGSFMVVSVSYDARGIREAVREAYSAASKEPRAKHAFPVGKEFAQSLGYPSNLLAELPYRQRQSRRSQGFPMYLLSRRSPRERVFWT